MSDYLFHQRDSTYASTTWPTRPIVLLLGALDHVAFYTTVCLQFVNDRNQTTESWQTTSHSDLSAELLSWASLAATHRVFTPFCSINVFGLALANIYNNNVLSASRVICVSL
jgi:hypothetical protein